MNKLVLLAIPAFAIIALVGFAAAHPFWTNPQNMTIQEKNARIQILDEMQKMVQDQKDYINGVITQEQFQDRLDQHQQAMLELRQEMRDALQADPNFQGSGSGCPMAGNGKHMGRGMMWGF